MFEALKRIEFWAIFLSVFTFVYTQWDQTQKLEAQTIADNRERLRVLITALRKDREENEAEITIDIWSKHYATYMDTRKVMDDLPPEEITPSQYLAVALESWSIGARGFESLELAAKARNFSEHGSIDQLSSLSALGDYYFQLAELYPDKRAEFVPLGQDAYERMDDDWPAGTDWRRGVLQSELLKYNGWKQHFDL